MSNDASKDEILSSEEIEALVERASEPGFDDGEFKAHDFSGGQLLSMSRWTEFSQLIEKQAEALQAVLSSEFGVQITVEAQARKFEIADGLLMEFPQTILASTTEPFGAELHFLLPGNLLTELVNHYLGGSQTVPTMPKAPPLSSG